MELDKADNSYFGVLIKQGAEAKVYETHFLGKRAIVKERFSKKYRHPSLDSKLTLKRLNAEARCMIKARRLGAATPALYAMDPVLHTLTFEFVEGPAVKEVLLAFGENGIVGEKMDSIAMQIGSAIGKLHDGGLIHGDLTTSNMLLQKETNQLVLIDFGLSYISTLPVKTRRLTYMCLNEHFSPCILLVEMCETTRQETHYGWIINCSETHYGCIINCSETHYGWIINC